MLWNGVDENFWNDVVVRWRQVNKMTFNLPAQFFFECPHVDSKDKSGGVRVECRGHSDIQSKRPESLFRA